MSSSDQNAGRIASVDVLRGLTMAAMIVVNNPGTWSAMYPALRHAPWGATPAAADLIFPTFLFLVGVSTPLALGRRLADGLPRRAVARPVLRRGVTLFAIGIGLNLFPDFDLATVRLPGVLQRIAVVYLACALAFLTWGRRGVALAAVGLTAGYAALLAWVPMPGAGRPLLTAELSLPVWLDDLVLGAHTWRGPGDPEGLLSTLPAIATGLLGVLAGMLLRRGAPPLTAARRLALPGLALLAAGALWCLWQPPAKELWTGSYALLTGGAALLSLAAWLALVDGTGWRRGLAPVTALGRHALAAFVAAHLVSDLTIGVIRWPDGAGGTLSLHHFVQRRLLASWLPPEAASLTQSLLLLAVVTAGAAMVEKRRRR